MMDTQRWIVQLETEMARALGQSVSVTPGGGLPEAGRAWLYALELPGADLAIIVDSDDLGKFLIEGRLIEEGQADAATVRELWEGILESVSARLGGKMRPVEPNAGVAPEPCLMRLGDATLRMALGVESAQREDSRDAATESVPPGRRSPTSVNYDLLLEVELDASVRFGSCELELKELLELGPGDVVELDRHLSDPVELIVGDKIVARGEVVLVNGNFGLRVTEVAEPTRRLESIRCIF
jgi:flagellar motor switch protein FliN